MELYTGQRLRVLVEQQSLAPCIHQTTTTSHTFEIVSENPGDLVSLITGIREDLPFWELVRSATYSPLHQIRAFYILDVRLSQVLAYQAFAIEGGGYSPPLDYAINARTILEGITPRVRANQYLAGLAEDSLVCGRFTASALAGLALYKAQSLLDLLYNEANSVLTPVIASHNGQTAQSPRYADVFATRAIYGPRR